MYKVSQKKWDLLLVIVAVNPSFFLGHLVVISCFGIVTSEFDTDYDVDDMKMFMK